MALHRQDPPTRGLLPLRLSQVNQITLSSSIKYFINTECAQNGLLGSKLTDYFLTLIWQLDVISNFFYDNVCRKTVALY